MKKPYLAPTHIFKDTEDSAKLAQARVASLSETELLVLGWLEKRATNKTIAERMGRSPRTVDGHVEAILRKLHVRTRTAAVGVLHEARANACDEAGPLPVQPPPPRKSAARKRKGAPQPKTQALLALLGLAGHLASVAFA